MFFLNFISFLQQKHVSRFILQLIGAASHVTTNTRALKLNSSCFELLPLSSLFLFFFSRNRRCRLNRLAGCWCKFARFKLLSIMSDSALHPRRLDTRPQQRRRRCGARAPSLESDSRRSIRGKKKKNQMSNQLRDKRITTQNCLHMNVATKRRGRTQIAQIQVFENPRFVILQSFLLPDGTFHQI